MPEHLGPRHAEVRRLRELLRDARARAAECAFVVEGPRAVGAALERGAGLERVYLGAGADRAFAPLLTRVRAAGVDVATLKEGVLERVGSTVTPQPVLAVAPIPYHPMSVLARDGLVLLGVELSDPGNVGTLIRSAEAAGAAAIVLSAGSVDAYNPKVVRASAGAIFGIPVVDGAEPGRATGPEAKGLPVVEALDALGAVGRMRLGARAAGGTPYFDVDLTLPVAVVLGNEAHGLGAEVEQRLDGAVTIPMHGPAESLNVAMAGSVLCFEAARQREGSR